MVKRRNILGTIFLLLIVASAAAFIRPQSHALGARQDKSPATRTGITAPLESSATEVTSAHRHSACKRNCEDSHYRCVASKKAKGWSDDRAEKTCGLAGRTCKGRCDQ